MRLESASHLYTSTASFNIKQHKPVHNKELLFVYSLHCSLQHSTYALLKWKFLALNQV